MLRHAKTLYVIVLGTIFVLISFPDLAVNLSQCVGIPIFGLQFTMPHMASNGLKKFASHNYIMVFVSMTWVMRVTGGHGRLQNLLCFLCLPLNLHIKRFKRCPVTKKETISLSERSSTTVSSSFHIIQHPQQYHYATYHVQFTFDRAC